MGGSGIASAGALDPARWRLSADEVPTIALRKAVTSRQVGIAGGTPRMAFAHNREQHQSRVSALKL